MASGKFSPISGQKKLQEVNSLNLFKKDFEKFSKNSKYLGVLVFSGK